MSKSGFYFIKDEEKSETIGKLPQSFKISSVGLDDADVLQDGFRDEGCDRIFLADKFDGGKIVEVNGMNQSLMIQGHPGTD
jgi:hypothetical protein